MGRYSNLHDQGERLRRLLKLKPNGPRLVAAKPRQVRRRLLPEDVNRLITAYETGATVFDLADQFHIHRTTVASLLKSNGIPLRLAPLTPKQVQQAIDLYATGNSLVTVGKIIGCDQSTVHRTLLRAGVRPRPRSGWRYG